MYINLDLSFALKIENPCVGGSIPPRATNLNKHLELITLGALSFAGHFKNPCTPPVPRSSAYPHDIRKRTRVLLFVQKLNIPSITQTGFNVSNRSTSGTSPLQMRSVAFCRVGPMNAAHPVPFGLCVPFSNLHT